MPTPAQIAYRRNYYQKNKERMCELSREYYSRNVERIIARVKANPNYNHGVYAIPNTTTFYNPPCI